MDLIIDIIVEILFGSLAEGFVTLSSVFIPKNTLTPKAEKRLRIIFAVAGLLLFVLLVVGIVLLIESHGKSVLGLVFVILCGFYVASSIALKIITKIKNNLQKKKEVKNEAF